MVFFAFTVFTSSSSEESEDSESSFFAFLDFDRISVFIVFVLALTIMMCITVSKQKKVHNPAPVSFRVFFFRKDFLLTWSQNKIIRETLWLGDDNEAKEKWYPCFLPSYGAGMKEQGLIALTCIE